MRVPITVVAALLLISPADAGETASYRYRIHHQWFGDIGEHRMVVGGEDPVVVEHAAELTVEIFGVRAFHRRSQYREVWRGDRLMAFDGLTIDNDEVFEVTARAEGNLLIVEGAAGRIEAPAATAPSEPSLRRAIEREQFFDIKTGALLEAAVVAAGSEPIETAGRVLEADRFEVGGDLEQHVWFDASDLWVQWRLWRQGAAITLTRDGPVNRGAD